MRHFADDDPRRGWGIAPRACVDLQTPAEASIRAAIAAVEAMEAHPALTDVVIKLGAALGALGRYIDEVRQ